MNISTAKVPDMLNAEKVRFERERLIVTLSDWSLEPGGYAIYWEQLDDGVEICHLLGKVKMGMLIPDDHDKQVKLLDRLLDEVGENEKPPLASLMEVIGLLIEKYEDEHVAELA